MKLDLEWVNNVQVNLSAVERRTATLIKRRSVKKEYQAAWLLKAITLIDLTTLSGDDTYGKVERLCEKAIHPLSFELQKLLEIPERSISVAALCVYHHLVKEAKKKLKDRIPIAAVSTGFPAGLSSFKTRKQEIIDSINNGADEVDMVISRGRFLQGDYSYVFDEIAQAKEACGQAHLKVILEAGELVTLENVCNASELAMEAGADFIKTSTGKITPAATPQVVLVMLEAIRDFYIKTGKTVGMKPAGGISTAKKSLQYLVMLKETLGDEWMNKDLFRFGASSLANDILMQLKKQETGIYQSLDYFSKD
mgnify:CR=1 FL=1